MPTLEDRFCLPPLDPAPHVTAARISALEEAVEFLLDLIVNPPNLAVTRASIQARALALDTKISEVRYG